MPKSFPTILLSVVWLWLGGGGNVLAQLDLRLETPKSSYLQYAAIPVFVHLKNLGGSPLELRERDGKPWMEMIVQSIDGLLIRAERPLSPPEITLRPGEEKTLPLDLAPHFLVREPGAYRVRASALLPSGQSLLTEPLPFLVGRGEVLWTQPRGEGKDRRIFSILRFYEDPNLGIYLRVEVPGQNQVFPSHRLGPYLPLGNPTAEFDGDNHLFLLYALAPGQHRLTVVNQDGRVLREEDRQETLEKPRLVRSPDGQIDVQGGTVILPSHLREKLSTLQGRSGTAPAAP
ncbi:MAG: hypothetical protein EBT68_03285 [Verrucomicrobia bacterium]|nr:hypothetical protein [Verrucomicrobiota bacterium]